MVLRENTRGTDAQVSPSSLPPHDPPPQGTLCHGSETRPEPPWHRSLHGLGVAGTTVPQAQVLGSRPAGKLHIKAG